MLTLPRLFPSAVAKSEVAMSDNLDHYYERLIAEARRDPDIIGVALCGSRGKNARTRHSDYDVLVFVKDGLTGRYEQRFLDHPADFEVSFVTLDWFRNYAAIGSAYEWDRYNWTHLIAPLDKTGGELQQLIDQKGIFTQQEARIVIERFLDAYLNQVYRSIKCLRDGNQLGFRLEANDSISPLLAVLFALHNGRIRPYYKYLEWELTNWPLELLSINSTRLLASLQQILSCADCSAQQLLLGEVQRLGRAAGFGAILDAWEGKDEWARTFSPAK